MRKWKSLQAFAKRKRSRRAGWGRIVERRWDLRLKKPERKGLRWRNRKDYRRRRFLPILSPCKHGISLGGLWICSLFFFLKIKIKIKIVDWIEAPEPKNENKERYRKRESELWQRRSCMDEKQWVKASQRSEVWKVWMRGSCGLVNMMKPSWLLFDILGLSFNLDLYYLPQVCFQLVRIQRVECIAHIFPN